MIASQKSTYRRYRLHQKIKEMYRYQSSTKTVFLSCDEDLQNKYVLALQRDYNYTIQLEIPLI